MREGAMAATAGVIQTGLAPLYTERRGSTGLSLLLIPGGGADGGLFNTMLEPLGARRSVITYDRRGNSRSPRPDGWLRTSIEEQADDAAALITAVGLRKVSVFGTSWGALIALDLALRHSDLVHTAVIHEAPLFAVLPDAAEIAERRRALVSSALAAGEYGAAFAGLVQSNNGNVLDAMDGALRERLLANAQTFFELELPGFGTYLPSAGALAAPSCRIVVSAGELTRGTAIRNATEWIAAQLGTDLVELPGGHAPYLDPDPGPTTFGATLLDL
jgi:pimeloyl-ACP methyl ester carboxylesterase